MARLDRYVRRALGVLLVAGVALAAPVAAHAATVTLVDEKFPNAITGRPGWSTGTLNVYDPNNPRFSGAAPEVVLPGSASMRAMPDGNAGSLWLAQDFYGAEVPGTVYDNIDAYYSVKIKVTADSGTSGSAKADVDAAQALYGGLLTRLEAEASTSAVVRSGSWSSEANSRYSNGQTMLTSAPNDFVEFIFQGDSALPGPNAYNPRRRVGVLVGRLGSGRSGVSYQLYLRPPTGGEWAYSTGGSVNEAAKLYMTSSPSQNRYPSDMDGYARYSLDLRDYEQAGVSYWWYKPGSVPDVGGDWVYVQIVDQDTGDMLHQVQAIQPNMWWSRWYQVNTTLNTAKGAGRRVWLQFRAKSDSSRAGEGVYFDDVVVTGITPPPAAPSVDSTTHPNPNTYYNNVNPRFNWTEPPSSTIAGYSWAIDSSAGTTPSPTPNLPASQRSVTATGQPNGTRWFHVRAVDTVGQAGDTAHRKVMIDAQAPSTPSVDDGVSGWSMSNTRTLTWSTATDALSGLGGYHYKMGSDPYVATSAAVNSALVGPLPQGQTTLYVRAVDNAGNTGSWGSHQAQYDGGAPTTPTVWDAGEFTPETTRLSASWSASDFYSGINRYEYAIGTSPGGTSVRNWTNVGTATSVTATGLSLSYDVTYTVSVRAYDNAGWVSGVGFSDGITPKSSELPAPAVTDDGTSTADGTKLRVYWSPVSGAQAYRASAGTGPGGTSLAPWSGEITASATQTTLTGLSVPDGTTAYVNVQAKSLVGNWGAAGSADGILVDGSAPPAPTPALEATTTNDTTRVRFTPNATDPHSGLSAIRYALGTSGQGSTNVTGGWRTIAPTAGVVEAGGIALSDGNNVWVSVRGVNTLGSEGSAGYAGPLLVDTTPPQAITLLQPGDGVWTANPQPTFSWQAVTDTGSGVAMLSLITDSDRMPLPDPGATSAGAPSALSEGTHTWAVAATDVAGNGRVSSSRTIKVDLTSPTTPTVAMHAAVSSSSSTLGASWSATDLPSGVDYYRYAVGDQPLIANIRDWATTTANSVVVSGLSLGGSDPRTYYISVRAYDRAGQAGAVGAPTQGTLVKGQSSVQMTIPSWVIVAGRPARFDIMAYPPGAKVSVFKRVGGVTSTVGLVDTDGDGKGTHVEYPEEHASYWAEVEESLNAGYAGSQSVRGVLRVKWRMGLTPRPWVVRRGSLVRFYGFVRPAPARRYAYLQRYAGRGRWYNVRRAYLNRTGNFYRVYYRMPRRRGSYYFRLWEPADRRHYSGYSRTVRIRTR